MFALSLALVVAGCADDIREATSGGSPSSSTVAASTAPTSATTATPDPSGPVQDVTEQSDLGVALGGLPLPAGTRPRGGPQAEGATVSQVFETQGNAKAAEVLGDDYIAQLEADGWEVIEPVADRGDGVAATLMRGDLELLLVAQDGPDDDAGNATLNVVIEDREG